MSESQTATTQDQAQTETENLETDATFADLDVDEQIVQALADKGIYHPFPIQTMAIPIALTGADLIGQARTGTGKTLAFGIPLLQHIILEGDEEFEDLSAPGKPQALVMTPTRELALQVSSDISGAAKYRKARVLTIYGGVSYDDQLDKLIEGVDIVVGTPGRVLDLVNRHSLDLSQVTRLVLDEADEMLDMGFLPDVERILAKCALSRQSLLFSATMPTQIVALARSHMNQPVHVRAEGHDAQVTVPDTTQFVYQTHSLDKPEILGKLLQAPGVEKMMIFTHTKRAAQRVADDLVDRGFDATSIHGDLSQAAREKALKRFRHNEVRILVATDVAARGIDVAGVSHVVNYECPDDEKTYVHRIGRTGRAGALGVALTLVDAADMTRWKVINRILALPFPEPLESYSTSPNLLADLGIPEGTKGRIKAASPLPPKSDRDHDRGGRDGDRRGSAGRSSDGRRSRDDRHSSGERRSEPRQRRDDDKLSTDLPTSDAQPTSDKPKRKRHRTRNGQPVQPSE
ncbi:MAG: DEAD/DEAH box helicase [Propionibacteriaceae bacterium]|jgi:superfamily II DNA/RNA helicase|nr:DEAD/DEAH box helicase [Propionibacteriaceae bacterium]